MEIREVSASEWQEVKELYLSLLRIDPGAFVDEYEQISQRSELEWKQSLSNAAGTTFAAIDGDKCVGMGRISYYESLPGIPVLHKLGVLPEFRNRGIGRKLIKAREDWAMRRGAQKIRLYVIADRVKTIEFSSKNGYKITETIKSSAERSDGARVDVVIMEKNLSDK